MFPSAAKLHSLARQVRQQARLGGQRGGGGMGEEAVSVSVSCLVLSCPVIFSFVFSFLSFLFYDTRTKVYE